VGDSLIPISDEQATAIQEAIKTLQGIGRFLKDTFGTVPQDLVGLLGGDWLKVRRAENLLSILQKARERLKARNVDVPQPASLSVALPILIAAADESRDELQDIWARLLAAAADPSRAGSFRIAFIEAAKKMDPLDAAFLFDLQQKRGGRADGAGRNSMAADLHVTRDEIDVSWANLQRLELLTPDSHSAVMSPFGREFLRAVSG
jgi:Abortive infection alpha